MVIAGHDTEPEWAALDLCAQAEHGDGALLVAAVELHVLDAVAEATERLAAERPGVSASAPLALVHVPDSSDAVDLCNAFAPEHLEIFEEDAELLAERITTAGCVFAGRWGATAFGDYAAGSNHVLPTGGAGRFTGPLGPGAFRRRISTVQIRRRLGGGAGPERRPHRPRRGLPRPRRIGHDPQAMSDAQSEKAAARPARPTSPSSSSSTG